MSFHVSEVLYAYYGDDFTGSTDVLEALAAAGLRSVLFLGAPSEQHRRQFQGCQAYGIAGDSRSRSPQWMSEHLPGIFAQLGAYAAPIVHYKTCSTFDSSPHTGSIGRAMEIGRSRFHPPFIPIVVAAPHLRRYVAFGNLFAAAANEVYRIDRHPTMRQHPVTPMHEADLRRHLAMQTALRIGLIDLPALQSGRAEEALASQLAAGQEALLFDGVTEGDLAETGRILWSSARRQPLFATGSAGLTYSLLSAWKSEGVARHTVRAHESPKNERLLVISGSCSPVTEAQIRYALQHGYQGIAIDPNEAGDLGSTSVRAYVANTIAALESHGKVVLYSSLGPLSAGVAPRGDALGRQMGSMLREIISATRLRRVLLAGGDTSSHAIAQLGLHALTWAAATEPGAPLCRAHSDSPELDGLELVLKGGQVGGEGFFERVRATRVAVDHAGGTME